MDKMNIHQREARLLERVAELEQENIVRESGFQTMVNSMKVSMRRIVELEAALCNLYITRFEIDKILKGSTDESTGN